MTVLWAESIGLFAHVWGASQWILSGFLCCLDVVRWSSPLSPNFFWSRCFPVRQLVVFVQAPHWKADVRPPAEGCTRTNSFEQVQSRPGSRVYYKFSDWDPGTLIGSVYSELVWLLKRGFQGPGEGFSFCVFFGLKYRAKNKFVHSLGIFLSGSAKLALWLICIGTGPRGPACLWDTGQYAGL